MYKWVLNHINVIMRRKKSLGQIFRQVHMVLLLRVADVETFYWPDNCCGAVLITANPNYLQSRNFQLLER